MDLTFQASMSVLDTDLERLLEEQRRKLSALGIFPPTRHTSDAHSADNKIVSQPTVHTSLPSSNKTKHPSELFTTSRKGHDSAAAGDFASSRLDRVAEIEERIARLLGVTRDDGEGPTSKKFHYDALLRPAMADMPQSAADVLNRIRQKSRAEMSAVHSVKSSQSSTVHPNTIISRLKTVVETETSKKVENTKMTKMTKMTRNTTTVTKSESQLSAKKTLRPIHSEMSANVLTAGKSCEDALSYVDITAKTLGKEATVQIMKAKLTAKEAELSNISETATKNQQLAQKKTAELRQLEQEHRELKEKQIEQEKKVRACMKQLDEARRTSEALTAEVERLSTETKERRKGKVQVRKKAMPEISVARLAAANDKAVKELVTLKEQNKVLKEVGEKSQKDVENQRKKHDGTLKKFLSVVQKQEALMKCVANQKSLSGHMQLLKKAEDDFHKLIDVTSISR